MLSKLSRFYQIWGSENFRFYAFVAFLCSVFLMGGGSRDDIESLIILRPLTILFGLYCLILALPSDIKSLGIPFYLLLVLMAIMVLQLTPLPPSIWALLPGRAIYVEISNLAGLEQPWRPMSLSPSGTRNSFFSLFSPLTAFLFYAIQTDRNKAKVIKLIVIFALMSIFWGAIQILGPRQSALYFYRITNPSDMVGFFANKNHQAVLMASIIPMIAYYISTLKMSNNNFYAKMLISGAIFISMMPAIMVVGSRSGLIISSIGLFFSCFFIYRSNSFGKISVFGFKKLSVNKLIVGLFGLIMTLLAMLSIYFSRATALDRLVNKDATMGLRFELFPYLWELALKYAPWGSGFGSFEHIYKNIEPTKLLSNKYLNEAHNDWMQFLIEGGIFSLILLLTFMIWFCWRLIGGFRSHGISSHQKSHCLLGTLVVFFIGLGSLGDYPLRVPSIMVVFALACAIIEFSSKEFSQARETESHKLKGSDSN